MTDPDISPDEALNLDVAQEAKRLGVEAGVAKISEGRRTPWWVRLLTVIATLLLAAVLVDLIHLAADSNRNADGLARNHSAVKQLAQQVRNLGGTPVVEPSQLPGPTGAPGPAGPTGATGRGISGADTNGSGDLVITYSDGSSVDVGHVVGPRGHTGAAGRGVASASITDGDLIVTYTDGTTSDFGRVVGPQGQPGANGPAGAQGQQGQQGPQGANGQDGASGAPGDTGPSGPAGPTGETGPSGPAGPSGAAGRGITSISCSGSLTGETFVITFDDGTTETVQCTPLNTGGDTSTDQPTDTGSSSP